MLAVRCANVLGAAVQEPVDIRVRVLPGCKKLSLPHGKPTDHHPQPLTWTRFCSHPGRPWGRDPTSSSSQLVPTRPRTGRMHLRVPLPARPPARGLCGPARFVQGFVLQGGGVVVRAPPGFPLLASHPGPRSPPTPWRLGMQPWALSLPDKELCLREALAVCTPPAPEPSAKRPGS